ncbi:MAG: extracellular solute-binding protein [Bacillota bacterium]|nr:extracellular solute-binding protein [Bacillota bacterium]
MKEGMARKASIVLTGLVMFSLFGCSSGSDKTTSKPTDASVPFNGSYPIKSDVTLKYWMILHNNVQQVAKNFGELPLAKRLEEKTGIKVKYIHPPKGQEKQALSVLIASGTLPDIIEYNWWKYPGGPNNAIDTGVIQPLDKLVDNDAPNLKKILKDRPDMDKMVKTDDGHYYVFPFLRPDDELLTTFGPVVRKDWLDELNIGIPETLDDWYNMLTAFKEKKKATAPMTATTKLDDDRNTNFSEFIKLFAGATNSYQDFYIDNNQVKFGPMEPNRKNFFETMAKWYKEKLIDQNFAQTDNKGQDSNMLSGKSGATVCSGGSGLGKWLTAMKSKDPKFNLVPVPYPAAKKGETPMFGVRSLEYSGPGSAAISAKSKNADIAARYLDYMYSEEGHMLMNFGFENETYKLVDNEPVYTDFVMNNPEKKSSTEVMSKYMRGHTNGAFVQDKRYIEQYYALPQQKEAFDLWAKNDQKKYRMLPITPNVDESSELSTIVNNVNSYVDEMTIRFITGQDPISKFDDYVAQLKKLKIDRALEIYQAALDRYNKR